MGLLWAVDKKTTVTCTTTEPSRNRLLEIILPDNGTGGNRERPMNENGFDFTIPYKIYIFSVFSQK